MRIPVNPSDCTCRECKNWLIIVDADDVSLTVECTKCGITYNTEMDGLNDGGAHYWPIAMAKKQEENDKRENNRLLLES